MAKVRIRGFDLHYEMRGQGYPVVLIHHLAGNLSSWRFQIPELSKHFKVVAYELRGHGDSESVETGYSIKDQTEDLVALLKQLNLQQTHVVGHSIGGSIALNFAIQHPQLLGRVVAVAPPLEPASKEGLAENKRLLAIAKEKGMEAVAEARRNILPKKLTGDEELWSGFKKTYGMTSILGYEKTLEASANMPPIAQELSKIQNPVLGISGDLDALAPNLNIMATKIPNFKAVVMVGCGHFPTLENTVEFNRNLTNFLL